MANNKEHNRGQKDASKGKYNPRTSLLDYFASNSQLKKIDKDRGQYDKGWSKAKKERKS